MLILIKDNSSTLFQCLHSKKLTTFNSSDRMPVKLYAVDYSAEIKIGDVYIMDGILMNPVNDKDEADRCNNHWLISKSCAKVVKDSFTNLDYIIQFYNEFNKFPLNYEIL